MQKIKEKEDVNLHVIFGFTIAEWVGIFTIIGMATGVVYRFIVKRILDRLSELNSTIKLFDENSRKSRAILQNEIENHESMIIKHDAEIQNLYNAKNWHRSKGWHPTSKGGEI